MIHDQESYIITIRRRNVPGTAVLAACPESSPAAVDTENPESCTQDTVYDGTTHSVTSPLPGIIVEVRVGVGETVKAGQTIAVLEAMKMENEIQAEHDGTVESVNVSEGESVLEGTVIATVI